MEDIEDNIVKHEGVYIGEDIEAEDVCQVVVKQTKLLDKEDEVKKHFLYNQKDEVKYLEAPSFGIKIPSDLFKEYVCDHSFVRK